MYGKLSKKNDKNLLPIVLAKFKDEVTRVSDQPLGLTANMLSHILEEWSNLLRRRFRMRGEEKVHTLIDKKLICL